LHISALGIYCAFEGSVLMQLTHAERPEVEAYVPDSHETQLQFWQPLLRGVSE
jgi:hypothetical protein